MLGSVHASQGLIDNWCMYTTVDGQGLVLVSPVIFGVNDAAFLWLACVPWS